MSAYDTCMLIFLAVGLVFVFLALVLSWYLLPRVWLGLTLGQARRVAGVRPRSLTVGDVTWQYLEGGRGPTLVLLHGFAAEADHWLPVAGLLRRHFHLLVPDLPGFAAQDDAGRFDFAIPAQAGRVAAWLESLGVERCLRLALERLPEEPLRAVRRRDHVHRTLGGGERRRDDRQQVFGSERGLVQDHQLW